MTVDVWGTAAWGVSNWGTVDATLPRVYLQAQFGGTSDAWVDITEDMQYPVKAQYGIRGNGLNDRVARTGVLQFGLRNGQNNSSGTVGYYSPGHASVREGFAPGLPMRLTITDGTAFKRFYGRIAPDGINAEPGLYGPRVTNVKVRDWMGQASQHIMDLPELAVDKSIDEVLPLITAEMAIPPLSTDYATGVESFAYVFDTVGSRTPAMSEISKAAISETGYVYAAKDGVYGETLKVDARYTRISRASAGTITDTESNIKTKYGKNYTNKIQARSYPRRIDAAATTVLWALQRTLTLNAGETRDDLIGNFTDPDGGGSRVSGTDMVTPLVTTDYLMNAQADGGGADLSADLAVTASYGANGVRWTITNNNAAVGYVTKLQCRGKGIYLYDPVTSEDENTAGVALHGEYVLSIDQKYQDNPLSSRSMVTYFTTRLSTFRNDVQEVTFVPSESAALLTLFLSLDLGDRFTLSETISGISAQDYFINGIDFTIYPGGIVTAKWIPELADPSRFWILGTSRLGIDTIPAWG